MNEYMLTKDVSKSSEIATVSQLQESAVFSDITADCT